MSAPEKSIERLRVRDGSEMHCETMQGGSDTWFIGVHGIGEHLGRESRLSELFADQYYVFQYDLRGHGRSDGRRGYVDSFSVYYDDLEDIVAQLASRHPAFRYALFGHSMGALIAAGFVQGGSNRAPPPERLFLGSPPIGLGGLGGAIVNRLPRRVVGSLSRFPVSVPIAGAINRRYISHEKGVVDRLKRDPLVLKRLHSRLLCGLVEASRTVFGRPIAAPCPLHAAVGSADRIVSCPAARRYFAEHEPTADFHIVEGAYHELHNESARYREPYLAFLKRALGRA